jgi:hypothetical protein
MVGVIIPVSGCMRSTSYIAALQYSDIGIMFVTTNDYRLLVLVSLINAIVCWLASVGCCTKRLFYTVF